MSMIIEDLKSKDERNFLVEHKEIPGTPFMAVRHEDEWLLMLGNFVLWRNCENYGEVLRVLEDHMWEIIAGYTLAIMRSLEDSPDLKGRIWSDGGGGAAQEEGGDSSEQTETGEQADKEN